MQFTLSHEWIDLQPPDCAKIGISEYAQKELGKITYIQLPTVGSFIAKDQVLAIVESAKAAADIYSPLSGHIIAINQQLVCQPALLNESAEQHGWLCLLQLTQQEELDGLMDNQAYTAWLHTPTQAN